ncbi:30S ribosomal protein S9 [Candidatus Woesearchaeota archaeon]|nr:30S ribosomal protein S9 [Candidatus Woesearchaeota archaeon]
MKVINTIGKRKLAVARAVLKPGKGIIRINSQNLETFYPKLCRLRILEPLMIAGENTKKVNVNVKVYGGGIQSQAEAVRQAIARALVQFTNSKQLKQEFLNYDRHLLISDVRFNEPHKGCDSKPRRARQKSYR